MTPIFWQIYSNASCGKGFLKISAIFFVVLMYSNLIFCSVTCSWRKWYLIGICLVLECITGFFEILMALVLSQKIVIGCLISMLTSLKASFIHIICVQQSAAAIYSASVVERDIDDYFLLSQETRKSPIKNAFPLVLFRSSMLPSQSASE